LSLFNCLGFELVLGDSSESLVLCSLYIITDIKPNYNILS